jgi:redox-sensitive bicupin YhaK (pirin superfamily)
MTAGRGIAHSERTPPELRSIRSKLFGIQSWVALSANDEETNPDFVHHGAPDLPVLDDEGKVVRVIAGSKSGGFQLSLVSNRRTVSLRPLEKGAHRFDRGGGLLLH